MTAKIHHHSASHPRQRQRHLSVVCNASQQKILKHLHHILILKGHILLQFTFLIFPPQLKCFALIYNLALSQFPAWPLDIRLLQCLLLAPSLAKGREPGVAYLTFPKLSFFIYQMGALRVHSSYSHYLSS